MRIRVYSPEWPYPPVEGAHHVILQQIEALKALGHVVEVVSWMRLDGGKSKYPRFATRLFNLIFRSMAFGETVYYQGAPPPPRNEVDLEIFHYTFVHPYLMRYPRTCKRVAHFLNLESVLYQARAFSEKRFFHKMLLCWNTWLLERHEKRLSELTDEQWFIGDTDMVAYKTKVTKSRSRLVGPTFNTQYQQSRIEEFKRLSTPYRLQPPVLGFIGGFDFLPNGTSAIWILERLAPALARHQFKGKILLLSRDLPSNRILRLAKPFPFVEIAKPTREYGDNLEHFWAQLSYFLIPHVEGSGVRSKCVEALAATIPTFTNTLCAEMLSSTTRNHPFLTVSDDPDLWATTICTHPNAFEERDRLTPSLHGFSPKDVYSFLAV